MPVSRWHQYYPHNPNAEDTGCALGLIPAAVLPLSQRRLRAEAVWCRPSPAVLPPPARHTRACVPNTTGTSALADFVPSPTATTILTEHPGQMLPEVPQKVPTSSIDMSHTLQMSFSISSSSSVRAPSGLPAGSGSAGAMTWDTAGRGKTTRLNARRHPEPLDPTVSPLSPRICPRVCPRWFPGTHPALGAIASHPPAADRHRARRPLPPGGRAPR